MKRDISFCSGCYCMTNSIRKGKLDYACANCGHDKTLGDIMREEAVGKTDKEE